MRTFEVGGSINYCYPVAFQLPHDNVIGYKAGTPLMYDIHRYYWEKAPESLNPASPHYMGLALKIMSIGGMWGGSIWEPKVLLNSWN